MSGGSGCHPAANLRQIRKQGEKISEETRTEKRLAHPVLLHVERRFDLEENMQGDAPFCRVSSIFVHAASLPRHAALCVTTSVVFVCTVVLSMSSPLKSQGSNFQGEHGHTKSASRDARGPDWCWCRVLGVSRVLPPTRQLYAHWYSA